MDDKLSSSYGLLSRLEASSRTRLEHAWRRLRFAPEQLVLDELDDGQSVFFVLRGTARAAIYTEKGQDVSFISLDPGDCFGEFAAIDGHARSSSVVAISELEVGALTGEQFRAFMADDPAFSLAIARMLVGKLRVLTERMTALSSQSAEVRIRNELLRLAERNRTGADRAYIARPPTQATLAAFLFVNRESVAREMARMRREGLIERDGRSVVFPSIARLQRAIEAAMI